MNTGILYIVATPIGNLGDITYRAVDILNEVDLIVCEDTRTTKRLLDSYRVSSVTLSLYGRGSGSRKPMPRTEQILAELKGGKNVAFVSDAGTPGISDPGNQLVEAAVSAGVVTIPVPGASSLTSLISVAGIDLTRFIFLGFPPHKKGRQSLVKKIMESEWPVILFESKHRIGKLLNEIADLADEGGFGGSPLRMIVGRELTKMHEEIIRGDAEFVRKYFKENREKIKGEFVIIIYKENDHPR